MRWRPFGSGGVVCRWSDVSRIGGRRSIPLVGPVGIAWQQSIQRVERLGIIEKQSVIDHAGVVVCQRSKRRACGNELEAAGDRRFVVHPIARSVFLAKEDGLVRGYGIGNFRFATAEST